MLDLYPDEMRADFQQFYGLDLDAALGRFEFRRLETLARQLPPESRTMRAMSPQLEWSTSEYLLALIADHLSFMRYEQAGGRRRKPKPVPRPKARAREVPAAVGAGEVERLLFGRRDTG